MTEVQSSYYAHANPFFIRAVASHGAPAEILDVGCWNGTLGKALIAATGSTVDGIERDPEQAAVAEAAGYRRVAVANLDLEIPSSSSRYDFVLFGDVLEHLVNPQVVLETLAGRTRPGGRVLVSLPNIAFAVNRLTHLIGRWDYRDYGILDRTHLRFYTRRTMVDMLESAGLEVLAINGYVGLYKQPWLIRAPLRMLGRLWPSLFAIQIVLEARHREV